VRRRIIGSFKPEWRSLVTIQLRYIGWAVGAISMAGVPAARTSRVSPCAPDNGGITLPAGFCATVFADSLPAPRHLYVMPNGDVYVSLMGARAQGGAAARPGGVILLRDANSDGQAETNVDVARGFQTSDVGVFDNHLYTENGSAVFRFPIKAGQAAPAGPADTIVSGLPAGGRHGRKTFTIGRDGSLYVNVGSATNACEAGSGDAEKHPPDPCVERETRAGIWRFDARKPGQHQSDGVHYAIGHRNGIGLTIGPDGGLWSVQHGRDNLFQNFPGLFDAKYGANNPAEELFKVTQGDDYGWPYCYYSNVEKKLVDAPEYGGDGKKTDRCADKKAPVAAYPGHWAPNGLMFYTGKMFPDKYKNGAFIAFHGSWNRPPEPQDGYRIVFQPMRDGRPSGAYEVFADKFNTATGGTVNRRPTGVAQGPDGALYIADDQSGRIWKVIYTGK
jgi:glucose/arabinose dehydrogenase